MRGVARLNDRTLGACAIHGAPMGGTIVTGSPNVECNDRAVARLGDDVEADCGCMAIIITACGNYDANDMGVARMNDQVGSSPYTATIITASSDTFTG